MRNRGCRGTPLLVPVLLLQALACTPPGTLASHPEAPELGPPSAHFERVVFEGYRGTAPDFSVEARRADLDAERTAVLDEVRIRLSQERAGQVEILAPRGEFEVASGAFRLTGGVRGTTSAGERFHTDELRYDRDQGRLWTDTSVRLEREGLALRAAGMTIDVATQRIQLTGGVRAELGADS